MKNKKTLRKKWLVIFLFILGAIPLIVYPFVLLVDVMILEGYWDWVGLYPTLLAFLFYSTATLYPVVFVKSIIKYKKKLKLWISCFPLIYLFFVLIFWWLYSKY